MSKRKSAAREVILALDISLKSTGWAVVNCDNGSTRLISFGEVPTDPKTTHGERLRVIREGLSKLTGLFPVTTIVKEAGFSRFPKETQALFKVHGVAEELFAEYGVLEYAPATIKKTVTGNGRAKKHEVEEGVREILSLDASVQFNTDDASDAVAVALTHLIKSKLMEVDAI